MKILKISHNHNKVINSTLKTLKLGGLVVFPSDTVYGLLVDATNEEAVRKLIEFKNRPAGKKPRRAVWQWPDPYQNYRQNRTGRSG